MQYQTISQSGSLGLVQNQVLRNTYMMLALTMIPTIIGAFLGLSTNFSFMAQSPIMAPLLMFAVMMGMLFAVAKLRNSVWGIAMLLGFTFVAGWFLGPILQAALHLRNGADLRRNHSIAHLDSMTGILKAHFWLTIIGGDYRFQLIFKFTLVPCKGNHSAIRFII